MTLQPHGLQNTRALCPPLYPGVCAKSCPLNLWCYLIISSSPSPFSFFLPFFPALRIFSDELTLLITCPKYGRFSFSIRPSNEYSGLISFRIDQLTFLQSDQTFSSVQLLSRVWLFVTPWIAARQASLSITNSQSLFKLMSIESVMPSNHLILCCPFSSCPQSLPASGSFPMSQLFKSDGQSIGVSASASILPMNTQDWSPLGWTGWISLQSKGLSRAFSNTTVQKHQFFGAQLSSQSNSHIRTWPLEKP